MKYILQRTGGCAERVALLVSAWIEIDASEVIGVYVGVALLVSAWIEIERKELDNLSSRSRTPRECVD